MNSGLSIFKLWVEGGLVIQLTGIILLLMSIASWTVMVVKGMMIYRAKEQAKQLHDFGTAQI